jgi:hypothetical protein
VYSEHPLIYKPEDGLNKKVETCSSYVILHYNKDSLDLCLTVIYKHMCLPFVFRHTTGMLRTEVRVKVLNTFLQEMGWGKMDWIEMVQDRDRWRALLNAVMNYRFIYQKLQLVSTAFFLESYHHVWLLCQIAVLCLIITKFCAVLLKHLTPKLNPSVQSYLPRIFTGDFNF